MKLLDPFNVVIGCNFVCLFKKFDQETTKYLGLFINCCIFFHEFFLLLLKGFIWNFPQFSKHFSHLQNNNQQIFNNIQFLNSNLKFDKNPRVFSPSLIFPLVKSFFNMS